MISVMMVMVGMMMSNGDIRDDDDGDGGGGDNASGVPGVPLVLYWGNTLRCGWVVVMGGGDCDDFYG